MSVSLGVFVVANMILLFFSIEENHKDAREDIISVLLGVPLVSIIINLVCLLLPRITMTPARTSFVFSLVSHGFL